MQEEDNGPKLTATEWYKLSSDAALEAIVSAVPYVGTPLASLYFGEKRERRFKRLELFYEELSRRIEQIKGQIHIDKHDPEALVAIMENIHEKIEVEHLEEKRKYLQNYLVNTLLQPTGFDYDERKFFLEILASMTLLECHILAKVHVNENQLSIRDFLELSGDRYSTSGAVSRLQSYGLVETRSSLNPVEGDMVIFEDSLKTIVSITALGKRFAIFCLTT